MFLYQEYKTQSMVMHAQHCSRRRRRRRRRRHVVFAARKWTPPLAYLA